MLSQDEIDLKRFLTGKHVIKKSERKFLLKYVIKGLPASLRGQFWLATSGASRFMQKEYDPGYYQRLCKEVEEYPNPNFNQVLLDLQRTYPTDPFF